MHTLPAIAQPIFAMFTGYAPQVQATYEVTCSGRGSLLVVHTALRFTKRRMRPDQAVLRHHRGQRVSASDLRDVRYLCVTELGVFAPTRALHVLLDAAHAARHHGVGHPELGVVRYCCVSPQTSLRRVGPGAAPPLPAALVDGRLPAHPQLWQAPLRLADRGHDAREQRGGSQADPQLATLPHYYHRLAASAWPAGAS
ncbi:MAG TPA: hypothetical protein VFZ66_27600 [Herpetosiphonaceae bacterium]